MLDWLRRPRREKSPVHAGTASVGIASSAFNRACRNLPDLQSIALAIDAIADEALAERGAGWIFRVDVIPRLE